MATKYISPQYTQALTQGGLTAAQAGMYEALVQYGTMTATRASFLGGVSRTLGYKILAELESMGLVVKDDRPKSVAKFSATHPLKLKELAEKRLDEAKEAKIALDGAIFKLISDFNRVSGQGAAVLHGVSGLRELLEKQLTQNKPLFTTIIENSPKKLTFSVIFEDPSA